MKKIITVTLIFCAISFINAQTKLISHKSHSGKSKNFNKAMNTFGIASSNFGSFLISTSKTVSNVPDARIEFIVNNSNVGRGRVSKLYFKNMSYSTKKNVSVVIEISGFININNRILAGFDRVVIDKVIKFKSEYNENIGLKYSNKNDVKFVQIMTYYNKTTQISRGFTREEIEILFTDPSTKKSCNLPVIEKENSKKESIPVITDKKGLDKQNVEKEDSEKEVIPPLKINSKPFDFKWLIIAFSAIIALLIALIYRLNDKKVETI